MDEQRSPLTSAVHDLDLLSEEGEEKESAFPKLSQDPVVDQRVPSWIEELANARAGRQSRASSVVSTRTRLSTTTFDDARSIDIQAGGQTFRISRSGDRITDTTAPPPYPGPSYDDFLAHGSQLSRAEYSSYGDYRAHQSWHPHPHRRHSLGSRRGGRRRVRIAMPDHEVTVATNDIDDDENDSIATPSRELTDEELRQVILDLPTRLENVLGINAIRSEADHAGPSGSVGPDSTPSTHQTELEPEPSRDNHLTALKHDENAFRRNHVRGILRNAPGRVPYHTDRLVLTPGESRWTPPEDHSFAPARRLADRLQAIQAPGKGSDDISSPGDYHDLSQIVIPQREEADHPPTVGDINELSQVYNKVIRNLDREHRLQLQRRDRELHQLRVLLHEKDTVYRQELKGRDFIIEDLKNRLDRIEETIDLRLERARNEVEDLWEARWREHQTQLLRKCGLIKPALEAYSASATQTVDPDAPVT